MIKIFAHRGFVTKQAAENSLASLHKAHQQNFSGIEFDVWFVDDSLVINHDMPEKNKALPQLHEYFIFKNDFEYWIDFKNLNEANAIVAIKILAKEIEAAQIDMKKVFFAPFITDLNKAIPVYNALRNSFKDAQIMAVCKNLAPENFIIYHKDLQKNHIKFLSIRHQIIDKNFTKIFSDITLFAWTVNDLARVRDLHKIGVKNFTSDIITPQML